MTSMVLGDSTLESLTPSVKAPLVSKLPRYLGRYLYPAYWASFIFEKMTLLVKNGKTKTCQRLGPPFKTLIFLGCF